MLGLPRAVPLGERLPPVGARMGCFAANNAARAGPVVENVIALECHGAFIEHAAGDKLVLILLHTALGVVGHGVGVDGSSSPAAPGEHSEAFVGLLPLEAPPCRKAVADPAMCGFTGIVDSVACQLDRSIRRISRVSKGSTLRTSATPGATREINRSATHVTLPPFSPFARAARKAPRRGPPRPAGSLRQLAGTLPAKPV